MGIDIFMAVLGYAGAVGIAIFSLPGLIHTLKTKRTSGINPWMFLILALSALFFAISGFYNVAKTGAEGNQFSIAVASANILSFTFALLTLIAKFINCRKAKKAGKTEREYEEDREKAKNTKSTTSSTVTA